MALLCSHNNQLIGRHVAAQPVPQQDELRGLADRLNAAQNPLFVMGSDVDTELGWRAGVKLSEICGAPVFLVSEPARIPFPTNHPNFLGTLNTTISKVCEQLTGYDLVVVFGGPSFRYHAWTPGAYLPKGTALVTVTADADQAARAPMGDAIVGDPAVAMEQLAALITRTPVKIQPRNTSSHVSSSGSKVTVDEFNRIVASVCPPETVFTTESPSLGSWWETAAITRPKSFFCGAGGGLGFALPAAVGVSLAYGKRPVEYVPHFTEADFWPGC